jgi:lipopolysaccharide biosynthesis glycosyltransferase
MLHSLLAQHPGVPVRVDCLHGGDISARNRSRIEGMVMANGGEIVFHEIRDQWVAGLPVKGFTGKATWYRFYLDELLPDTDRILYLDVDLLVMESLLPLWRTSLNGYVLGAVTNVPPVPSLQSYFERPELGGDPYFNAGVLLLDLARMRSEGLGQELRSFSVKNADRLSWRDQDALNEVLHARRRPLHPRWNCMNSVMYFPWANEYFPPGTVEEARSRPAIRHFEGPAQNKPWHLLSTPEVRRLYAEHRRHTPWPRVRPTGCTPLNLMRWTRKRLGLTAADAASPADGG